MRRREKRTMYRKNKVIGGAKSGDRKEGAERIRGKSGLRRWKAMAYLAC